MLSRIGCASEFTFCAFFCFGQTAVTSSACEWCVVLAWDKVRGVLVWDISSQAYVFMTMPHCSHGRTFRMPLCGSRLAEPPCPPVKEKT